MLHTQKWINVGGIFGKIEKLKVSDNNVLVNSFFCFTTLTLTLMIFTALLNTISFNEMLL